MNKPVILAQAANAFAQLTSNAARIVHLAKPADGQAHSIALLPDQNVVLDMSGITNDKITLVRVGTKLIILFDNQSTLVVEPAYDDSNSLLGNITFNVGDGRTLNGLQFAGIFPISDDQSVLPAAGDSGNSPTSGANFSDPDAGALGDGGGPLDLLGNEDLEPFTIAEVLNNLDPPDVKPEVVGEYGVVRLLERHLDLDQDADDLGPGDTTGTDGADVNNRGETVQLGGVIFRAGSEAITVKLENIPGLVVRNEAGAAIDLVWTLSPDGTRLEGNLPGDNGPLAIIIEISGPLAAGPFGEIEPTVTVTLTTDFPHSDTNESGGDDLVTIEGLEVVATDLSGDRAVAEVLIEIEDDAPEFTADADPGLVDEDGVLLGNDGDSYPAFNPNGTSSDVPGSSIQAQGSLHINWGADRDDSNDSTTTIPYIGVDIHRQDGVLLGDTTPNGGMGRAVWFSSATVFATIAGNGEGEGSNAIPTTLTSRGDEVTFQLIESGTRIVGWADGRLVMTAVLSDDGSGSYRFTLFDELDHFGDNAEDDLALTFSFTARDSDGDTIDSTFTVTVNDDAPELGAATTATVDEDGTFLNPGLPGSTSGGPGDVGGLTGPVGLGVLNIDWGADDSDSGPANRSVVFNGVVNGQAAAHAGGTLTAGGDQVYLWVSADGTTLYGYTGTLADPNGAPPSDQRVFTVTVNDGTLLVPGGGYSFQLNANLDHPIAGTEDELLLNFGFKATDADGDSVIGSFSVSVDDDTPVIGNPVNRTVDEDGGTNQATNPGLPGSNPGGTGDTDAPISRSGNLDIDWGADSDNEAVNGGVNGTPVAGDRAVVFASGIAAPAGLSSNGFDIIYNVTGNGTLLTAYRFENGNYYGPNGENLGTNPSDAARVFTVSLIDTGSGSYTFTLLDNLDHASGGNENEINLDFGFVAYDSDGDSATDSFRVTVDDDTPKFTAAAEQTSVDEDGLFRGNDGDSYPAFNPAGTAADIPGAALQAQGSLNISWGADAFDSNDSTATTPFIGAGIHRQDGVSLNATTPNDGMGRAVWFSSNAVEARDSGNNIVPLTSRGDTVTFELIESGTRIVGWADGRLVMTAVLSDDGSGSYIFTLFDELDHNGANVEDDLALKFNFTARDSDGDTINSTFTVKVNDDAPELGTATTATVDEDGSFLNPGLPGDNPGGSGDAGFPAGPVGLGALNIDWGADDSNSGSANRSVAFNGVVNGQTAAHAGGVLTAGGQAVYLWVSADGTTLYGYTGTLADPISAPPSDQRVFTVTVNDGTLLAPGGGYSFQLNANLDHPVAGTEDELLLTFGFKATDADGDSVIGSFSVSVDDDTPVIGSPNDRTVDEDGGTDQVTNPGLPGSNPGGGATDANAGLTATQSLEIDWGADSDNNAVNGGVGVGGPVAGDRAVVFASGIAAPAGLSSNGFDIIYSVTGNGTLLTAYRFESSSYWGPNGENLGTNPSDAARVFTVSLSDSGDGSYTFTLLDNLDHAAGNNENNLNLDFGFVAYDSDGDSATDSFRVTVDDDTPVKLGAAETESVNEDDLLLGNDLPKESLAQSGNLNIGWGADAGDARRIAFDPAVLPQGLFSNGDPVEYLITTDGNGNERLLAYVDNAGGAANPLNWVFSVNLSDAANGSYTFTLLGNLDHADGAGENVMPLSFGVVAYDSDGDPVKQTFQVDVTDDTPLVLVRQDSVVEEEQTEVAGDGIDDTSPGEDADFEVIGFPVLGITTQTASATLGISWGADNHDAPGRNDGEGRSVYFTNLANAAANISVTDGSVSFNATNLFSRGDLISYQLFDNGTRLEGRASDGRLVFEVTLNDDGTVPALGGSYTFTLNDVLDHPDGGGENKYVFTFDFTAEDGDGDTAGGEFSVTVLDDKPGVPVITVGNGLIHDETAGVQSGNADADALGDTHNEDDVLDASGVFALAGFTPPPGTGAAIGYAQQDNAVTVVASYGGDGPGATATELSLTRANGADFTGQATNLFVSSGARIYLFTDASGVVVGREGSGGSADANGDVAFALHIADDGTLTLVQYLPIRHNDTASNDEIIRLNAQGGGDVLFVTATSTDFDGDTATSTSSEGLNVRFDDDGPSILANDYNLAQRDFTLDEDDLPGGNNTPPTGQHNQTALLGKPLGVVWGADDGDTRDLKFTVATGATALKSGGDTIIYTLSADGHTLTAHTGDVNDPVFVVALDPTSPSGAYDFTLYRPLDHAAGGDENSIALDFTFDAYDGDGDKASSNIVIRVIDDVPLAPNVIVNPVSPSGTATLIHDETAGVQSGGPDTDAPGDVKPESDVASLPGIFNGLTVLATAGAGIGFAERAGAVSVTPHYGADGPGTATTAVQLTDSTGAAFDGGATNLFDTATGNRIFLYTDSDSGIVVGRIGSGDALGAADAGGDIAFAIAIDGDGKLSLVQYRALEDNPGTTNDRDDAVTLGAGGAGNNPILFVTATSTDFDTDPVTSAPQQLTIRFDDDGPTVRGGHELRYISVSESGIGGAGGSASWDYTGGANPSIRYGADGFGSAEFTGYLKLDIGGNLAGNVTFDLSTGPQSTPKLTSGGEVVVFERIDATTIVGYIENGGSDIPVIEIKLTGSTVTTTLHQPLDHIDAEDGSPLTTLVVDARIAFEDGDGDSVTSIIRTTINDDKPSVSANADVQLDDDLLSGGLSGVQGNTTDGAASDDVATAGAPGPIAGTLGLSFGADGGSVEWLTNVATSGGATGFTYEKSGSSLLIKQNGNTVITVTLDSDTGAYTVTQNAPVKHADGNTENDQSFTLTYRVTDGDDDPADGTLTINTDDDTPTVRGGHELRYISVSESGIGGAGGSASWDYTGGANPSIRYGADGFGSAEFTGYLKLDIGGNLAGNVTFDLSTGPQSTPKLTSGGEVVVFERIDATTILGYIENGGSDIPVIEIKLTGSTVTTTLHQPLDHIDAEDGSPLTTLVVDARIAFEDGDGDSVTSIIRTTINDHTLSIGTPQAGVVTEDAAHVALANADFSADSLATGQPGVITDALGNYAHQNPSGWTISDLGNGGIYNPIPSIVDQGSQGAGTVVWLRAGATLSQNTGEDLVEGANYTVRVNVGDRTDQSWPGGEVRLIAVNPSDPLDVVTLATLDLPDPGQGQWTTVQLNSGPISAALAAAGYELRIEVQQDSAGGGQVLVDNVELVVTPPIVATGSLAVNWGADNTDNDGNPVDRSVGFAATIGTDAQVESANGDVTSNGANVLFVRVSDTEIYGVADDDNDGSVSLADRLVFHVTLDDGSLPTDQGSYRFVLLDNLDHVNAGDENSLDLDFGFTATDADGDPANSSFKVTVDDDDKPSVGAQPSIANGDFTQGDWPHVEGWGVWDETPQGWTVEASDVNGSTGDNIRLEKIVSGYGGLSTPNGAPMVDLGATPGNVKISQIVQGLEDGKSYVVEFLAGAPQPGSAGLQVFWGGVLIATIPPTNAMTSYSYVVTAGATPAANTLTFQETGSNDNHGTYLADIGIHVVVDEDDLSNGSDTAKEALTVAGSLNIDWGADDANPDGGAVDRTIAFTTAAGDSGLTSGGEAVHYFISADGETLIAYLEGTDHTDPANQVFVVTLSDELAGGYSFTLTGKLDHPTGNGENVLPIAFGFTATDADGDPATGSFTVAVRDDVPTAVDDDVVVQEDTAFSGNVLANDVQGADDATLTKVSFDGTTFVLINTGTPNGGGFDHVIAGVGVYTFNANGDWTFDPALDFNGAAGFSYIITDGDGDDSDPPLSFNVEIDVTPVNDAPVITIPVGEATAIIGSETAVSRFINETNSPLTANGTLTVSDVDTGSIVSAQVVAIGGGGFSYNIVNAANFLTLAPTLIDDAGETPNNLAWTFNSGSETFDFLPHGNQIRLTYTIRVTDEHGLTDDQLVTVLINGTNDAPVITIPAGETTIDLSGETAVSRTLTETDSALIANGTLTVKDVDATSVVSAQVVGISGSGANYNIADAANFLTVAPGTINDAGETPNNLTWTFNSGSETFDFLPHGFQVRLTYTIRVTDDRGATDEQLVTILVTGTNDAPEITIPAGEMTVDLSGETAVSRFINETDAALVTNGTLTVTDVDNTSVVSATVVGVTGGGAGYDAADAAGFLTVLPGTINDAGETSNNLTWTFNSGSETFDFLPHGNQIRLTYTIRVTDDRGATDEQLVTILINGTNDAPVISGVSQPIALVNAGFEADTSYDQFGTEGRWHGGSPVGWTVSSGNGGWFDPGPAGPDGADGVLPMETDNGTNVLWLNDGQTASQTLAQVAATGTYELTFEVGDRRDANLTGMPDFVAQLYAGATLIGELTVPATMADGAAWTTLTLQALVAAGSPAIGQPLRIEFKNIEGVGGNDDFPHTVQVNIDNVTLAYTATGAHLVEGDAGLTANGVLDVSDVDTDIVNVTVDGVSATGPTGGLDEATLKSFLTLSAQPALDGTEASDSFNWTFDSQGKAFNFLAVGETLTLTYTLSANDNSGAANDTSAPFDVTITITGTDDAPVIGGVLADSVSETGDIAGIFEAGRGGGLEPTIALNGTITTALGTLLTAPETTSSVLGTVAGQLGGNMAQAIAVVWDYLDDIYQSAGPNQANVNQAFTRLGIEYATLVKAGTLTPLIDVMAKYTPDNNIDADLTPQRVQSLHDNLLGNLTTPALTQRYGALPGSALHAQLADLIDNIDPDLLTRPYYEGSQGDSDVAARQWDVDNGFVSMATGQVVVTDVDGGSGTFTFSGNAPGAYGTFTVDPATGEWAYVLNNQLTAVQQLALLDTETEIFTVTAFDGSTTLTTQVTVTINGANDAPVIEASSTERFVRGFDNAGDSIPSVGYGAITLVDNGDAGYIPSSAGGGHALVGEGGTGTGPFTNFGGYSSSWTGDWSTQVKVFLDPANLSNGQGFDWSVAATGSDGNHQRDFIFHVWKVDGQLYVAASNNTDSSVNAFKMNAFAAADKYAVGADGWYTLEHRFTNVNGVLAVELHLLDASGHSLWHDTLSNPVDTIPGEVGGSRYGWFTFVDGSAVAVDGVSMETSGSTAQVFELADGSPLENIGTHTATGEIAFSDIDGSGVHTASATFLSALSTGGPLTVDEINALKGTFSLGAVNQGADTVGWTYSAQDAGIDFLDAGETATVTYRVAIDDGDGGQAYQDVTVTVNGAADIGPAADGQVWVYNQNSVLIGVYGAAGGSAPDDVPYFVSTNPINAAVAGLSGADHTVVVGAGNYSTGGVPIDIAWDGTRLLGSQFNVDPRDSAGLRTISSSEESVVDGANGSQVFRIRADDVEINGFDIRNSSSDLVTTDGITGNGGDSGAIIRYNIVSDSGDDGLALYKHSDGVVEYNRIYATADGIEVRGNNNGQYPEAVAGFDNIVRYNEISGGHGNGGIYAYGASNTTIAGNYIHDYTGDSGIVIGTRRGYGGPYQDGGTVSDNLVVNSGENGIDVFQSDVTVTGNTVMGNNGWAVSVGIDYNNESVVNPKPDNVTIENNIFGGNHEVRPVGVGAGNTPADGPVRVHPNATNISFDDNVIEGTNGNNALTGTAGADILVGGHGNDTLSGGTGGADIFKFAETGLPNADDVIGYSKAQGDVLDLSALLDAHFNAGDNVANFVRATDDGSGDAKIEVNLDGTGGDWEQVATLHDYAAGNDVLVKLETAAALQQIAVTA